MAYNRYFKFIEIEYDRLTEQINKWLRYEYKKADIVFNSASPYGQILNVLKELFSQQMIYLKNTLKVLDISTSNNKKVIQQTALISGYVPGRAISATGTLKFKLKPGIDFQKEIGGIIKIPNKLLLKNINNSLNYVAKLNQDENQYLINVPGVEFYLPIIQGRYETQTFTGDNTINQSYSVNIPNSSQVENFNYTVTYNSIVLEIKDHLYDMLPGEYACYVRSGFNGGIDIFFGTKSYGFIPQNGSLIQVDYLLSDGSLGDILNPTINEWKIEGVIKDNNDKTIKIEDFFDIFIYNDINFTSDGDTIDFIKSTIPYISRNFVLATPKQFIYHLKRMNIFSKVNAFNMLDDNNYAITDNVLEASVERIIKAVNDNKSNDEIKVDAANFKLIYNKYKTNMNDNTIFLYLIPDITKYFNDNLNYFNIPFDVFILDELEQQKTLTYLKKLGTISTTTSIKIIQPKISRYVMHVYIRKFENANEENIKQEIITKTSDYLLNNDRFDRIPKSDFIEMYKTIDGIDSVSLYFVSEKNEKEHSKDSNVVVDSNRQPINMQVKPAFIGNSKQQINIFQPKTLKMSKYSKRLSPFSLAKIKPIKTILAEPIKINNNLKKIESETNKLLGIDPVHGDIIIEKDEYAVIRGGFRDRNGVWYSENPNENNLSSINITFNGISEK